ncbi:unnamed protein product [marine sediment metagenome]|uniref:Uncharacterized protein n=1 Tax=marine sediment metagenome TaxID=412755 RepID=X1G2Z1_9ZZZZ
MKFSKLFPIATSDANDFIEDIVAKGSLKLIEPETLPHLDEAQLLYLGPYGFVVITKQPKEGQWEVTIET